MNNIKHKQPGFTIVELLIVIVIIGILAAITVVAYRGIQVRTRDSVRVADLKALEKSLEMNYIDNGAYTQPETFCLDSSNGTGVTSGCGTPNGLGNWEANSNLRVLITQGFASKLPLDPINNTTYYYTYEPLNAGDAGYATAGQGYDLCARLEATGANYCINKRK